MATSKTVKFQQTETEVAVLQVQVQNIEQKVTDLKEDMKGFRIALDEHSQNSSTLMKEMRDSSAAADKALSEKISSLEKWRWMMMGAGIVIGSLGYDTVAKLLK